MHKSTKITKLKNLKGPWKEREEQFHAMQIIPCRSFQLCENDPCSGRDNHHKVAKRSATKTIRIADHLLAHLCDACAEEWAGFWEKGLCKPKQLKKAA